MRYKRLICLLLAAACVKLCACGIAKREVTINVKAPVLTMNAPFVNGDVLSAAQFLTLAAQDFEKLHADSGVTVNVMEYTNTDEDIAVDGCFGKEDAVDVLYNDYFTMEAHVYSGKVVPLDDIIPDRVYKDIGQKFWEQSTIGGKTYMMPYLYRQNVLAYNKELFKNAGLERFISDKDEILSWTMEEWAEILAALRSSMPETSDVMPLFCKNNQGDTHTMCYIRSMGSDFFDSKGKFNLNTPEGIAGLSWIKDCVDKGYMSSDAPYREILDNYDMWDNGQLAFFICNLGNTATFGCDYGLVNFPTVNGGCNTDFLSGFEIFDNGDKDRLNAAKDFLKFIYESGYLDYSASGIPCSAKVAGKYAEELKPVRKYIDNNDKTVSFTGGNPNWLGVRSVFYKYISDMINGDASPAETAAALDRACNEQIEIGAKKGILHP